MTRLKAGYLKDFKWYGKAPGSKLSWDINFNLFDGIIESL